MRPSCNISYHFVSVILVVALACSNCLCDAFSVNHLRTSSRSHQLHLHQQQSDDESPLNTMDRRSMIASAFSISSILTFGFPVIADTATATESTPLTTTYIEPNVDCLVDLPPIPKGHVRIYLCRHGQTENNRLRKVQGARVDPPINDNGILQATCMGKALARANDVPRTVFHSNLLRARLTAETAAAQIGTSVQLSELDLIGEVDFGPVAEGQPIPIAKAGMEATAAAWAIGNLDYRPSGGGDSGREVFNRASKALSFLAAEASKSNGCIAAVSHSAYLKILLAVLLDEPLLEANERKLNNGSINVIDIQVDGGSMVKPGNKAKYLGGRFSLAPEDFNLSYPACTVTRINENRHLAVL